MTADEFREVALSMPEAIESSHMGHPDFRANGRIFATLFSPDQGWGMVKLPIEEQETVCAAHPKMFRPVPGGWGRMGCTNVRLDAVKAKQLETAMRLAWERATRKPPARNGPKRKLA